MIGWIFGLLDAITPGPWYADIGALAGGLAGGFWLYKNVIVPIGGALWASIIAAPKIAIYTGRLVELLETDVLQRLDAGQERFLAIDAHFVQIDAELASLRAAPGGTTTTNTTTNTTTVSTPTGEQRGQV